MNRDDGASRTTWRNSRVAVTGATGFVGRHAALELRRYGAHVTAVTREGSDVRHLEADGIQYRKAPLNDVLRLTAALGGCEVVVHAAAVVALHGDWKSIAEANVAGTQNVLIAARNAGVRRVVHVSSIVAVGATKSRAVLDETAPWRLELLRVPYVTTKRQAEEVALAAAGPDLEVVVVNPGCVVGPDDVSRSIFGTLCRRYWRGRMPLRITGGNSFVDVRDVATGIRLAGKLGCSGERYLLTGVNRSYAEFWDDLGRIDGRRRFSVGLPRLAAECVGRLNDLIQPARQSPPYLTKVQAALAGWYFYFQTSKAEQELGWCTRPWEHTLLDTHEFWMHGRPQVRRAA